MNLISRNIYPHLQKAKKSILLLGPRQTGKSTLIRSLMPELEINLADESTYLAFAGNPNEIKNRLQPSPKTIFVDEIQRLPSLLNTIQVIIDESAFPIKFYLTGSGARKLKRGKANLLPGRIYAYHLGPLTSSEIGYNMNVQKALSAGTLPGIWTEPDRDAQIKTLTSYAGIYLKEEVQAEALTRNIEGFSRFFLMIAAESGKFLDLTKIASEAGIPYHSAIRFFEILEDSLIIRRCDAFRKSERKRLIQHPRFFFFDTGVLNGLLNNFTVSSDRIGMLFEHLIFNQIMDGAESKDKHIRISSYRTEHDVEVDFILELDQEIIAIEVKASANIGAFDLRGLKNFAKYYGKKHKSIVAYLGDHAKIIDGISILPWQTMLKELGL
ncbi:MAG: ATP-binding protein [Candidatus Omnitrophica bacterium]|nr:ATP-binding protein [Candidatus Omnitrophota bacterium]